MKNVVWVFPARGSGHWFFQKFFTVPPSFFPLLLGEEKTIFGTPAISGPDQVYQGVWYTWLWTSVQERNTLGDFSLQKSIGWWRIDWCLELFRLIYRWRPYRSEYTGSLQNSEVNHCRARLVLRWGTAREVLRVLPALLLCRRIFTFLNPGVKIAQNRSSDFERIDNRDR